MPQNNGNVFVLKGNQFLALFEYRHALRSSALRVKDVCHQFCESTSEERRKECKARASMTIAIPIN